MERLACLGDCVRQCPLLSMHFRSSHRWKGSSHLGCPSQASHASHCVHLLCTLPTGHTQCPATHCAASHAAVRAALPARAEVSP